MANIIIVEDDPIQIRVLQWTLSQHYDVKAYQDPKAFLKEINNLQVDMFLLDLNLPHMDGFALSQEIRAIERFANTPMIAVTADTSVSTRQKCEALSFTDFIEKPIFSEQFLETVGSYLQTA